MNPLNEAHKTHRCIILAEGRRAEIMCECGTLATGTMNGAVFIEDTDLDGMGTE